MQKSGKLELTWVGKYEEKKIEPRILVEDASKSYGDAMTENDNVANTKPHKTPHHMKN